MSASLDESTNNFAIDAPFSLSTYFYLMLGDNAYGYSSSSTDYDAYSIHLDYGSTYTIGSFDQTIYGSTTSTNVSVYDRNGKFLFSSTDYGTYSGVSFTAYDTLFYIVTNSTSAGYYGLRVENNSVTEVNGVGEYLNATTPTYAALDYTSDSDHFLFNATAGYSYAVVVNTTITDLFLKLTYTSTNQGVAFLSGSSGIYTFTPSVSGTYELSVSSNSYTSLGNYSLTPTYVPIFTVINDVLSNSEDISTAFSFSYLLMNSDAIDVDGSINYFIVKSVLSGTLLIGLTEELATPWVAGVNDVIDATHNAYWLPDHNSNGILNAFSLIAIDNLGIQSLTPPVQVIVNITSVNDAPTGADKTITVDQSGSYIFVSTDFGFTDIDGNSLTAVKVSSLPVLGQLLYNGVAITSAQVISGFEVLVADINSGKLTYAPAIGVTGNAYASFQFQVRDNGGVLNSGIDLDSTANTITVNVTPAVNLTLTGTAGVDTLIGGAGNDTITGLGSNDTLNGKEGSDLYIITATADHTAAEIADTGTVGTDEVRFTATTASTLTLYAGDTGIEKVTIGTGSASIAVTTATTAININATALTYGVSFVGNAGNNTITGGSGNDTLDGGAGNDTLVRAGAENLNKAISENLLPFKVREDIRMDQKNEKKSKKKSLTSI